MSIHNPIEISEAIMIRKAYILTNPGIKGSDTYCKGVYVDSANYKCYLSSPIGGLWDENSEIIIQDKASLKFVKAAILDASKTEYSLFIFCGHGYIPKGKSTVLQLNDTEEISIDELRFGSPKQTLIIDCCREIHKELLIESTKYAAFSAVQKQLNPTDCKIYYNARINECSPSLVILYSCSPDQLAGENEKGGYYSQSLLDCAEQWANSQTTDLTKSYKIQSVLSAHESTITPVYNLSGGRQTPQIGDKPRGGKHFPFCIIA
jgi:hypothetical protein